MNNQLYLCLLSALTLSFSLTSFAEQKEVINLEEITVTKKRIDDAYYVPVANTATRTDTPLMETPLSI